MKKNIGIIGFLGYGGAELRRILQRHPGVQVWLMDIDDPDERPRPRGSEPLPRVPCTAEAVRSEKMEAVLLATPAHVSMELAPAMLAAGAKVIDLSGAFRLRTPENYRRWYKEEHTQASLLAEAVYGLPEISRKGIAEAGLIANPGCYPTAANLAIQPLVEAGVIDRKAGIVCDAKSGLSGAGRKPSLSTSFYEAADNFSAYSILDHRHVPEVLLTSELEESELSFTAQLLPLKRGILETIYFRAKGVDDADQLIDIYEKRYGAEPIVRLYDAGKVPDLRCVQYTNYCDIGVKLDPSTRRAVVVTVIDNLGKGAAGQAVQNLNLALGYKETEALL